MTVEPFAISVDGSGSTATLKLSGELDLSGVPAFDDALQAVDPGVTELVVDLAGLTFVDSSGIACFVRAHLERPDRSVVLRSPSATVRKVLEVVDLGHTMRIEG